ncbi:MAG TPA: outer membrane protein assembly factor BamA [Myxococcota bacterium]
MRANRILFARLARVVVSLIALLAAAGPLAPGAARAQQPVKVLVAVLPFEVHSERDLEPLVGALADQLTTRLEASGRVDVVDTVVVREALVAHVAGERTEAVLRDLAREVGAEWVVQGSLTELAGAYSLDVRVTPAGESIPSRTMVYTADDDPGLRVRVDELADRVLEIVAGGSAPDGRVVEVRIEGAAGQEDAIRRELRVQPGRPFDGEALRADVARLRARPGFASAESSVERGPAGVVVTYRLVPAERILPDPAAGRGGGDRVAEVRVQGNRRIEADAIRARISTKPGDVYDPARIAEDVRQVHALGFFEDVRVRSEQTPAGRVLTFEIEENPVVRQITIAGNDSIDSDRIRDQLTLTTGATLDLPLLYENRDRIEALYRAEGFYQAKVGYEVAQLPNDAVAVNFEVTEGRKLRLREIRFEGNEHFDDKQLRSGLRTKVWRPWSYLTRYLDKSGTYAEPVFLQDLQLVERKYHDAGYLRAEVGEPDVTVERDGLVVTVPITEGNRYKVGTLDVRGDPTVTIEELKDEFELAGDEWFNRSHLTRDVDMVTRLYTDRGYFHASVNPLTRVDENTRTVDVVFDVQKGPLYFVRQIDIHGNTRTLDRVIRREMQLVEGELYSARKLRASEARLHGLGFFEEVHFEPTRTEDPDALDLDVSVVEKSTGAISFGAGYSTADSIVLSGSVNQSNLFGRGYGVRIAADIGGRRDRFYGQFVNRRLFDSEFSLAATGYRSVLDYEDFEQTSTGLDVNVGRSLDEASQHRAFLRYSFALREIEADDNIRAASPIFREFLEDDTMTSLVGLAYRMDTRNDRILPTGGYEAGFSLEGAGLGGFTRFARIEARGALYHGIPEWLPVPLREKSSIVLAARLGYALPFNDVDDYTFDMAVSGDCLNSEVCPIDVIDDDIKLPLSERYFLGGLGSFQLRGYKARSVGPRRAILYEVIGSNEGTGVFAPVGRNGLGECTGATGTQGDAKCNSLDDKDDDDFEDLDDTDVIGGSQFISLTAEYRFPISEALGLVGILFLDAGDAMYEDEFLFDVSEWRYGTGFGALWFSPFGPLQAFVGFPINPLSVEDNYVFEFSVGGSAL